VQALQHGFSLQQVLVVFTHSFFTRALSAVAFLLQPSCADTEKENATIAKMVNKRCFVFIEFYFG
jgi:hypothetical protein